MTSNIVTHTKGHAVNKAPKSNLLRYTLAVAATLAATTLATQAQSIIASATLTDVPGTGGTFDYTLTLNNSASSTSPIESLWYAWIPGKFFLPTMPSSASGGSSDWSANIVSKSIQFQGTAGNEIAPGQSASFNFVSTDTPAELAGTSQGFPVGESIAYAGAVDASSPSDQFAVQSTPEPSSLSLLVLGSVGWLVSAKRKLRV